MNDELDLVVVLNYYAPYVSGLTESARIVAEGMAARGWRVQVITSQHDATLPRRESVNGVEVIRTPVVARLGKGVVSPRSPSLPRGPRVKLASSTCIFRCSRPA